MGKGECKMKNKFLKFTTRKLFGLIVLASISVQGQQFNSDSWISKEHGTVTVIATYGERNSMLMNTFSLLPRWEFTVAGYFYNDDDDPKTDDGY